jgi:hypothetical protein
MGQKGTLPKFPEKFIPEPDRTLQLRLLKLEKWAPIDEYEDFKA